MIVLSPTTMPPIFGPVYLTSVSRLAPPYGYAIVLGAHPGCDGATVCTQATIEGGPGVRVPEHTRKLLFAGRTNYVQEFACGAHCAGSFRTTFIANGATYVISIKGGKVQDTATIERGLRVAR